MGIPLFDPGFILRQTLNNFCGIVAIFFYASIFKWREPYKSRKLAVHLVSFFFTLILNLARGIPLLNEEIPFYLITAIYFIFQLTLLLKCFEGSIGYKLFIFLINKLIEALVITMGYSVMLAIIEPIRKMSIYKNDVLEIIVTYSILNIGDLLFHVLFVLIIRAIKKLRDRIPPQLFFVLIPLSQMLLLIPSLIYVVKSNVYELYHPYVVWSFAGVLCACIGDIQLFVTLAHLREKAELEAQVKINDMQQRYYDVLEQQQQKIREMQHDINNHLTTIKSLVGTSEDSEQARYYSENLNKTYSLTRLDYCRNRVLNALLVNKAADCSRAGIKAEFEAALGESTFVSDVDLVILISNILDNAVASAALCDNAFLSFGISEQKGVLSIVCENSASPGGASKQPGDGKMTHGNGLRIIRRLAAAYDGKLNTSLGEGVCRVSLTLYDPQDEAEAAAAAEKTADAVS